jgi:hypothetical protein
LTANGNATAKEETANKEKYHENLERHGLDMAARNASARFIFVMEELVGKSILSFVSL